ncbi:hypothetical protein DKX38_011680 [Salix brachista]|uniref:Uncharacterized protein n=1 Tax=Salix brachista TaxID=2182728 RepID=A0A5N5LZB2_9ROSI|nr:hypothetical protein DKX38_011680 [Salix brachista]
MEETMNRVMINSSPDIGLARLGNNSLLVPSKFSRGRCLNCYSGPVQSIAGFFTCLVSAVSGVSDNLDLCCSSDSLSHHASVAFSQISPFDHLKLLLHLSSSTAVSTLFLSLFCC